MALVMHFGKPDYFITVTTNPNWTEIEKSLFEGQKTKDRPDISARVFKIKLDSIIDDLMKKIYSEKLKFLHIQLSGKKED